MKSKPITFVYEVGPVVLYNSVNKRDEKRRIALLRDEMDALLRGYFDVGPRSKVVKKRVEVEEQP